MRLVRIAVTVVGAILGLYVSVQLQWALIDAGVFGTQACRDLIIQPMPSSPSCVGPGPTQLPTIAGAILGGALAWVLTGWVHRRRSRPPSRRT
jgi:hypothetical protein